MSRIPPDFGGFLGYWHDGIAYLVRYGKGKPQEGVGMTPLNVLQARKLIDELIAEGDAGGQITEEHRRQSNLMPSSRGLEDIMPREQVDEIAPESTKRLIREGATLTVVALGIKFTPAAGGLLAELPNGRMVTLRAEEVDELIRVAGRAWEAMGL